MAEIEVYDAGSGLEVAGGVPVVASSEEVDNEFLPATNVNDGDTGSEWSIAASTWPVAWIYFDLGSSLPALERYRFYLISAQVGPTAWDVEWADDAAGPWTLIEKRVQDPPTYDAWMEFIPPSDIVLQAPPGVLGVFGSSPGGGAAVALQAPGAVLGVRGPRPLAGPLIALQAPPAVLGLLGPEPVRGPDFVLQAPGFVLGARGARPYLVLSLDDPTAVSICRCYLDLDGDVLELPIATVQTRLQEAGTSFMPVTLPGGLAVIDAIRARRDGLLSLWRGVRVLDGREQLSEIFRAPMTGVTLDAGSRSSTVSLTAVDDIPVGAPKSVTLTGVQSYADRDGRLQVRAAVDEHLRPGDTAVFDGGEFVVASVLILESARGLSRMEVSG